MGLHRSFDVLAEVLRGYRARGASPRDVDVTAAAGDGLRATVDVDVPVSLAADGSTPESATLTADGGLRVRFPAAPLDPPSAEGATVTAVDRTVRVVDGGLAATVDLRVDPTAEAGHGVESSGSEPTAAADADDGGADATDPDADPLAAARDESVPPYEDVAYLGRLYEVCDSFAEMSREIPMDVSSETVRRYMIDAGVHDPDSYDTSGAGASASAADTPGDARSEDPTPDVPDEGGDDPTPGVPDEAGTDDPTARAPDDGTTGGPAADDPMADVADEQIVTDGSGLPAGVDLADVADAVVGSRTPYEVHRHLGIDQERTRDLLERLDLLDLVLRRVDGDPDRRVSYEEVAARIREGVPPNS